MAQLIILASAIGKMRVIRFSKLQQSDKMKNETEIDSVAKRASVRLVAAAAQVYPNKSIWLTRPLTLYGRHLEIRKKKEEVLLFPPIDCDWL